MKTEAMVQIPVEVRRKLCSLETPESELRETIRGLSAEQRNRLARDLTEDRISGRCSWTEDLARLECVLVSEMSTSAEAACASMLARVAAAVSAPA